MSIEISSNICIGCKKCVDVCPGTLIICEDKTATIPRPERCWGCTSCVKECPVQAISLFLGEDIGGQGAHMTVQKEKNLLHWMIEKNNEQLKMITVDLCDSNKY